MKKASACQAGLRRLDAGWLYLLAGAALVSSMVLIGPADDLAQLRHRRDRLAGLESDAITRLQAYETFLEALDDADPMLVRRLAAAQLNLIPESVKPIGLIGVELDAHVDDWIHEALPPPTVVDPPQVKDSWLRRLAAGPTRLWTMLAGMLLIFIGLLPQADAAAPAADPLDEPAEAQVPNAWAVEIEDDLTEAGEFDDDWPADDEEHRDALEEVESAPHHTRRQLIVSEDGELIDADDEQDDDAPPRVQVVSVSASSAAT